MLSRLGPKRFSARQPRSLRSLLYRKLASQNMASPTFSVVLGIGRDCLRLVVSGVRCDGNGRDVFASAFSAQSTVGVSGRVVALCSFWRCSCEVALGVLRVAEYGGTGAVLLTLPIQIDSCCMWCFTDVTRAAVPYCTVVSPTVSGVLCWNMWILVLLQHAGELRRLTPVSYEIACARCISKSRGSVRRSSSKCAR